jgi:iron complex transport system permease protein
VILTLLVLTILTLTSLAIGSRAVAPMTTLRVLVDILTHPGQDAGAADRATALGVSVQDYGAVSYQRLPRTAICLGAGIALGLAGGLIQSLTRNPLAESGILGLNAGAAFAVALAVAVFSLTSPASFVWFALAGAFLGTVGVWLIGTGGRSVDPARLTLAGVALGAVLSGITSALLLMDQETFSVIRAWEAGSFADRGWDVIRSTAPFLLVGLVVALCLGPALNTVALGDDLAHALGTKVVRTRVLSLLAITLLAGTATAMAGPIAFVGLMIPHVARWIVGPDQRWIMSYAVLLAPILVLASDIIGRVLVRTGELQVGIVTAFLGAPVLVILVRRQRVSGL